MVVLLLRLWLLLLLLLLRRRAAFQGSGCLPVTLCGRLLLCMPLLLSLRMLAAGPACRAPQRGPQQLAAGLRQRLAAGGQCPGQLGKACCTVVFRAPAARRMLDGEQ